MSQQEAGAGEEAGAETGVGAGAKAGMNAGAKTEARRRASAEAGMSPGAGFSSVLTARRLARMVQPERVINFEPAPTPEPRLSIRSQSATMRRLGTVADCLRLSRNVLRMSEYEVLEDIDGKLHAKKSTFLGRDDIMVEVHCVPLGPELTAMTVRVFTTSLKPIHISFIKRHLDRLMLRLESFS